MSCEDGVVWLDNRCRGLRSWVNAELQFDLLPKVDGQTLHQERSKTRASSTTKGMENEEALKAGAVISDMANLVQDLIDQLLANSIVTPSIVI